MSEPSTPEEITQSEPPLWSIGLAVVIILGAPLVLYSLAPTGPIREGDTIFSEGQQRVQVNKPTVSPPFQRGDTCLLDPNSPLIVLHTPNDEASDSIVAQVQGRPVSEWPFCPLHAEVLLNPHQMFQKPAVFSSIKEALTRFSGREQGASR